MPTEKLNAALDIFTMFFTNSNTIDEDNIKKLTLLLVEGGRTDLADALAMQGIAAGLWSASDGA